MKPSKVNISLNLEHSYAEQLPDFVADAEPTPVRDPRLLQFNEPLAKELKLDQKELTPELVKQVFSGNGLPQDARSVAQAYAGHQFGGFVPQLGDGRAVLLGEVLDCQGRRRDIALKGSGVTPFSRGGDGRAAVGPVLREYLIGEAMHALGIPTTRALAAIATGEPVMRERPLPGAVLTRVASSHIRVGTFQFFAARRQNEKTRLLADYVIQRHYPEVPSDSGRYNSLLRQVIDRQASLIAQWMLVGFIHGVMNTDNMAISGETIDYGPCAFMESYNPKTVFSSIDRGGRYAYGNQPSIALWNLARFAETLLPLLGEDEERSVVDATEVLESFMPTFEQHFYFGALKKLGLENMGRSALGDPEKKLVDDWLELLAKDEVDYTLAWRHLAKAAEGDQSELRNMFADKTSLDAWLIRWSETQNGLDSSQVAKNILATNPLYIPRNHLVEDALAAATSCGDLAPFGKLLQVLQNPFEENAHYATYVAPAPKGFTARYRTFCGT